MDHRQLAVCRDCLHGLARSRIATQAARRARFTTIRGFATSSGLRKDARLTPTPTEYVGRPSTTYTQTDFESRQRMPKPEKTQRVLPTIPQAELDAFHSRIHELSDPALQASAPTEQQVLYALEQMDVIAASLMGLDKKTASSETPREAPKRGGSAASALLGSVNARKTPPSVTRTSLVALITEKAHALIELDKTKPTPATLEAYVQLLSTLHQPDSIPDLFQWYATTDGPKSPKAVHHDAASKALNAAIKAHDLTLAFSIIDSSFATPAYTRAKLIRQAGIPGAAFATFPLLAYAGSLQFSSMQSMLDPGQATMMAFAGIMTYAATVGTMGYVAITTANDQMDRVTWAQGIPLWERWIREDERAALDKVAGAWGFKSVEKRGDEEGEDWERLRFQCGIRGMVLDKVELMEGME